MTMRRAGPDHLNSDIQDQGERLGAPHFPFTEARLPAAGPVHRRSPSSRRPRRAAVTTSRKRNLSARRGTNPGTISNIPSSPAGRQHEGRTP